VTGCLTVSMYSPFGAAFRAAGLDIMRRRELANLSDYIEFRHKRTAIHQDWCGERRNALKVRLNRHAMVQA
jgi:hypothetical protein